MVAYFFFFFSFFCEVKCDWMSCIGSSIINRLLAKCSALDLEQNLCRRNSTHLWDKIQEVYTAEDVWSSQLSLFRLSSARNNLGLLCCSKSVVSNFKMIMWEKKTYFILPEAQTFNTWTSGLLFSGREATLTS